MCPSYRFILDVTSLSLYCCRYNNYAKEPIRVHERPVHRYASDVRVCRAASSRIQPGISGNGDDHVSGQRGASNQESIAQAFELDKGAVSKTVAKLETKGLVKRQVNPGNRREKLVVLDASAEPILNKMRQELQAWSAGVFEGVPEADRAIFTSTLCVMAANSSRMIHDGE